jgi:hypothetical protein
MEAGRKAHPVVCVISMLLGTAVLACALLGVLTLVRGGWNWAVAGATLGALGCGADLLVAGVSGRYPLSALLFITVPP